MVDQQPESLQPTELVDSPPEAAAFASATEPEIAVNTGPDKPEDDRPVRVLVQTKTHLVPGDKNTEYEERHDAMENLICQHVWHRDFDRLQEFTWSHQCHFTVDNVDCWFLVDHYGPEPNSPPPDPPVLWYPWTGTELSVPVLKKPALWKFLLLVSISKLPDQLTAPVLQYTIRSLVVYAANSATADSQGARDESSSSARNRPQESPVACLGD